MTPDEIAPGDEMPVSELRSRYRHWTIWCGIFTAAVAVLTFATGSIFFGVVALYMLFFTWNRWKEWQRAEHWLLEPPPENEEQRLALNKLLAKEALHPPLWERISNWVAGLTFAAIYVIQSVVVLATGGTRIKVLYAIVWAIGLSLLLVYFLVRRQHRNAAGTEPLNDDVQ